MQNKILRISRERLLETGRNLATVIHPFHHFVLGVPKAERHRFHLTAYLQGPGVNEWQYQSNGEGWDLTSRSHPATVVDAVRQPAKPRFRHVSFEVTHPQQLMNGLDGIWHFLACYDMAYDRQLHPGEGVPGIELVYNHPRMGPCQVVANPETRGGVFFFNFDAVPVPARKVIRSKYHVRCRRPSATVAVHKA